MAPSRKQRPVLYEVYRGSKQADASRRKPTQPPPAREHRSPELPTETSAAGSTVSGPTPQPAMQPKSSIPSAPREHWEMTVDSTKVAVGIAVVAVLLVITFETGRRFGMPAESADGVPNTALTDKQERTESTPSNEPLLAGDDLSQSGTGGPQASPADSDEAASAPPPEPPRPRARVALQRGYTYVVVQHFRKRDREAAYAAAQYLESHGIACATLTDKDVQVLATEPFVTNQEDRAAADEEKRRAGTLQERIRTLGGEYVKQGGGYSFKSCYLRTIK